MRPPCQTYGFPPVHFLKEGDIVFGKKRYDGSGNGRLKSSARPRCSSHPIKNDLVLTFIRKGCIFTNTAVPHVPSQCGVFLSSIIQQAFLIHKIAGQIIRKTFRTTTQAQAVFLRHGMVFEKYIIPIGISICPVVCICI